MKKQLKYAAQGAVGILALGMAAVQAQTIQSVEIEGTVTEFYNNYYYYNQVPTELENAATFKFVVEQDISAVPSYVYTGSSYEYQQFNNNVYKISYTFYDAVGAEIAPPAYMDFNLTVDEISNSYAYAEQNWTSDYEFMQWWGNSSNESNGWHYLGGYLYNYGLEAFFTEFSPYPLLASTTSSVNQPFTGWMESNGYYEEGYYYLSFNGIVTSILATGLDADGDGFADNIDTCPASLMEENVMFDGWLDSGVTNHVDASGCAIMDHYAACEVEEAEQPTSPWGWFQPVYSGPTYCEKQVSYNMQSQGVIDYTEGRMLRNALNLSYSSDERR